MEAGHGKRHCMPFVVVTAANLENKILHLPLCNTHHLWNIKYIYSEREFQAVGAS